MEMVKAIGLNKYYVTDTYVVHALVGVTFSVEVGYFLAIVGTSGSGKTTLLYLLGGLVVPTEGGVWFRGKSLKDMEAEERTLFLSRNIGFIFQQYNLVPVLSVYENIVLPLRLDGTGIDQELFEEIVMLLGMSIDRNKSSFRIVRSLLDFVCILTAKKEEENHGNGKSDRAEEILCYRQL